MELVSFCLVAQVCVLFCPCCYFVDCHSAGCAGASFTVLYGAYNDRIPIIAGIGLDLASSPMPKQPSRAIDLRVDCQLPESREPPKYSANWPHLALTGNARWLVFDRGDGRVRVLDYFPANVPLGLSLHADHTPPKSRPHLYLFRLLVSFSCRWLSHRCFAELQTIFQAQIFGGRIR